MKVLRPALLWMALLMALAHPALSDPKSVHWTATLQPAVVHAGEHAQVVLSASIDEPWHMYSLKVVPNGPIPTTVELQPNNALTADGPPTQPNPRAVKDENFENAVVEYYEKGVAFGLPVKIAANASGRSTATLKVRYQICKHGACDRPIDLDLPVSFTVASGAPRAEYGAAIASTPPQPATYQNYPPASEQPDGTAFGSATPATGTAPGAGQAAQASDQTSRQIAEAKQKGILNFLLLAFGFGFAALLTPCVFPMIPITVSFFAKSSQEKSGRPDLRGAFAYSLGIIGTFTGLGLLMTAIFGPAGINRLAQSPWTNLVLAALFIVLAANLFGAFEIILPSWLVDKARERKGSGGWLGPMAMGFAFTLTSFTCTVAFVGTLLLTAAQGDWFYPAIGMLAFSTAFALPFFLLALFPQYLARLPKSGSWMISVKAFMGFLELAAALKFLSNIDLYLQMGILTQPIFLAIWAGIAVVAGLYLWGWVRLTVDTSKRFGIPRRTIGALSIAAGVWCLAAINGADLGKLGAFLPPDPYPYKDHRAARATDKWEHDWDAARAKAKAEQKPIFINFTGAQCTNCRYMEKKVLPLPDVSAELDKFVRLELITDQIGEESKRNAKLQDQLAHVTTLPYYVATTPEGKPVGPSTGYTDKVSDFLRFVREAHTAGTAH